MPARRKDKIVEVLRGRIDRAVTARALVRGDRLPSTREMAIELDADPRTVAAAYRALAAEGMVELRARSGVYITPQTRVDDADKPPSPFWLAKILAEGIEHGYSTRDFCDHLREAALARKLRAVVIAATYDQTEGLVNELRHYYGLDATSVLAATLGRGAPLPNPVKRAHLLVTTDAHKEVVSDLARRLGRAFVLADVRAEIFGEWQTLLRREVFVIATDARFVEMLRARLATVPGGAHVRVLIVGRDDLSVISPNSPTYVTQAARNVLGRTRIPGRLVPPARLLDPSSVEQILAAVVRTNIAD
ncbi:MAG: GntR family transcriptional regulator [Gemmatimonadota bacterium]|nr:GntR family transcriptional regulator [Gemmatimonadota bacterium]